MDNFDKIELDSYGQWLNIRESLAQIAQQQHQDEPNKEILQSVLQELHLVRERLDQLQEQTDTAVPLPTSASSNSLLSHFDLPNTGEPCEEFNPLAQGLIQVEVPTEAMDASSPESLVVNDDLRELLASIQQVPLLPSEPEAIQAFLEREVVVINKKEIAVASDLFLFDETAPSLAIVPTEDSVEIIVPDEENLAPLSTVEQFIEPASDETMNLSFIKKDLESDEVELAPLELDALKGDRLNLLEDTGVVEKKKLHNDALLDYDSFDMDDDFIDQSMEESLSSAVLEELEIAEAEKSFFEDEDDLIEIEESDSYIVQDGEQEFLLLAPSEEEISPSEEDPYDFSQRDLIEKKKSPDTMSRVLENFNVQELDFQQVRDIVLAIKDEPVEYMELHHELQHEEHASLDKAESFCLLDEWLNKIDEDEENEEMAYELSSDLKGEMRAMLAYFDDFLKDLPEDKVVEFAESPAFKLYKKLYKELGVKR
ncbi:hypothetical protein [Entomospira culicis]|uniref:Uncharacterized protein n=1 Tax=Entomospira culicis TaxID=2719989 RepID=A0A968GHN5_9SPIO|nr:hypothetical protein [Entomospira culicis]NIZ18997.1 hypothetical protein [Entomospira culicis]NIZ69212.1 hypothetical protein [Entomospira culicis]WDI37798.1 hypothetical protein PVA46_03155 [Entomospira culicis]WDI39426.1 hypothetical protein PVA47_03160 [Entomospira culicis]